MTGAGITGSDYALGATTPTILNGMLSAATTFVIADDVALEGLEIATISLDNPTGGLGSEYYGTVITLTATA